MKHSLRTKLSIFLLALTASTFLIYLLINQVFLEGYYTRTKQTSILEAYKSINEIVNDKDNTISDIKNSVGKVCEKNGITIVIIDTANNIQYQYGNGNILSGRLQEINFGNNDGNIIKKTNKYILQSLNGNQDGYGYYEVWGIFNEDMLFLMRMTVESIRESVSISRTFFFYVGIAVTLLSFVVAFYISGKFTKPILKLATLSEKMSNLDFEAKYQNIGTNEIDILGNSMNMLSQKLESNILSLKNANNKLQKDIAKKEEIDVMRKEFISNVSHELKTPIALIQGYAEGLVEGINDDEQSRNFYCEVIMDEASKMNKMVKSLLTLNQLEFGNNQVQIERFDIIMVINGVISSLNYLLKQGQINLDFPQAKEQVYVYADEFQIEEIVTNYLTNAIHYATGEKKIEISITNLEKNVRISVYNTGNNIPEEEIDKIWVKFYKVDKARTREYGGSGIGLSIVKAIMDAHGKDYGVNNLESGVEFWFELDTDLG